MLQRIAKTQSQHFKKAFWFLKIQGMKIHYLNQKVLKMNKVILITGAKRSGKTTRLNELFQKHKGEKNAQFTAPDFALQTKAKVSKLQVVAIDDIATTEELECVVEMATACPKTQFIIVAPLEVKNQLSKQELEGFEVIEVAISLP